MSRDRQAYTIKMVDSSGIPVLTWASGVVPLGRLMQSYCGATGASSESVMFMTEWERPVLFSDLVRDVAADYPEGSDTLVLKVLAEGDTFHEDDTPDEDDSGGEDGDEETYEDTSEELDSGQQLAEGFSDVAEGEVPKDSRPDDRELFLRSADDVD